MAVRLKDRIEANVRQSDKVNSSLSIQLNSGTATVYNGSAAKSINVTPAAIGAPSTDGTGASGTWNITSASTQRLLSPDTRNTSIIPTETLTGLVADFKAKGTVGITASGGYVGVLTWRSYSTAADFTGGQPIQIAYTQDNELQTRLGNTSTWGSWTKLLNSNNYTSYTVKKDGTGASGTWGISISGNAATATKATQDASGNTITSSYLRLHDQWTSTDTHDVDTLINGITFAYNNHNAPATGIIAVFNCRNSQGYPLQLMGSYSSNHLYFRNKNGDINTWNAWCTLLDSNNYSNYALPLTGGSLTGLLTIYTNGKYYQIGCQNSSWAHHSTDASNGHWFNKDVAVQGNIYCGNSYNTKVLTVAGDRMTGTLTRDATSTSWIDVSHGHGAIIYLDKPAANGGATTCWAVKTNTGAWGCGNLSGNDNLYFVWGSDTNYNAGNNSATSSIYMHPNGVLYGAAWNDYAEFRTTVYAKAGEVVVENGDGTMHRSCKRLEPAANIVSDTYGFAIGETEKCGTPIAVAGRVLAYPYEDRCSYKAGDAVCSAPDGKVSKMTREEMVMYPNCIIGYVSEIPEYEVWGQIDVPVNGRIWIKVV